MDINRNYVGEDDDGTRWTRCKRCSRGAGGGLGKRYFVPDGSLGEMGRCDSKDRSLEDSVDSRALLLSRPGRCVALPTVIDISLG